MSDVEEWAARVVEGFVAPGRKRILLGGAAGDIRPSSDIFLLFYTSMLDPDTRYPIL